MIAIGFYWTGIGAALLTGAQARATAPLDGASVVFGDYDADGLPDALVVAPGGARLLHNDGAGAFVDRTRETGLGELVGARGAAWGDWDGDGALDLFLSTDPAGGRLFLQVGAGSFLEQVDGAAPWSGLALTSVRPVDLDADGLDDLHLGTAGGDVVLRAAGDASFEVVLRGAADPRLATSGARAGVPPDAAEPSALPEPGGDASAVPTSDAVGLAAGVCVGGLMDQATGACLPASSLPTLGMLFPLTADLFVDAASGQVGVGTTAPGARLDVLGSVRSSGQLVSTTPSGAPLAVASSARVDGLNADLLDGKHASAFSQFGSSVDTGEISAGAVTAAQLAAGAVASAQVLDRSLLGLDLALGAVTSLELASGAVSAAKLLAGAVGTAAVADQAITSPKIASGAVGTGQIGDRSVGSIDLELGAVTSAELASGAVTASKILAGSVGTSALANGAVTAPKLAPGAIGAGALAPGSVTSTTVQDLTLVDADVSPSAAIAGTKIAPNFGSSDVFGGVFDAAFGTTTTPTYRFAPGEAAGLSSPAVETLSLLTSGAERMRVASDGDVGIGTSAPDARLHVQSSAAFSPAVHGKHTTSGYGVWAETGGALEALAVTQNGSGDLITGYDGTTPIFRVRHSGNVQVRTLTITGGSDLVEGFPATEPCAPGTVVVADPGAPGSVRPCDAAYDPAVLGVVSGAGGVAHGLALSQEGVLEGSTAVALTGRVYVRATAEAGAIRPGDRLTTSGLAGHAMRAGDRERAPGTILGKALGTLDEGTGLVLVLVNLQ